jgi:carboxyl-terminal processing protease
MEIVKRYHYQRGSVIEQLKDDKDLDKAIEILKDKKKYREILSK